MTNDTERISDSVLFPDTNEQFRSRYTALQQKHIDLKNRIDLEFGRFARMNNFYRKALTVYELEAVPSLVAEAIVDIFELQFGVMALVDEKGHLDPEPQVFGSQMSIPTLLPLLEDIRRKSAIQVGGRPFLLSAQFLERTIPDAEIGTAACALVVGPDSNIRALLLGGCTKHSLSFYETPTREVLELFGIFAQQVGSLIASQHNLVEIRKKDKLLVAHDIQQRAQADKQRKSDFLTSAALHSAIASGDILNLATLITSEVAKELLAYRASVWFFQDNGSALLNLDMYNLDLDSHSSGRLIFEKDYPQEFKSLHESKCIINDDTYKDHTLSSNIKHYLVKRHIGALLTTTITVGGQTLGLLRIEHKGSSRLWTTEEIEFACALADQLALTATIDRRNQAEQEANIALYAAQKANKAKSEFLANMSHELRTPLNAILGLTEGLLEHTRGPVSEPQRNALSIVYQSGSHLLALINDILDLARIEANHVSLNIEQVLLSEVCESAINLVRQQALDKKLTLTIDLETPLLTINADFRRLKQILVNLISNAIKFTPAEGSIIVKQTVNPTTALVELSITDTGIGISSEDSSRLFEPFVQLDSGLARHHEGTGLGLSLVKHLVTLHNGTIALHSKPGKGSTFTVSLPNNNTSRPVPSSDVAPYSPIKVKPVLLVGSSELLSCDLSAAIQSSGYQVTVHEKGEGAIDAIRSLQPAMVLLDLDLPDYTGWEVLSAIKTASNTRSTPVIVIGDSTSLHRVLNAGGAGLVQKPLIKDSLIDLIHKINLPFTSNSYTVLLAEDNEWNVTATKEYLESQAFTVIVARDGIEAIEKAANYSPDVILMDIQMPRMDGLEAIRRLRALPAFANTPIVALTALAMEGDKDRILSAGATSYISKPIKMRELVDIIKKTLG